MKTILESSDFLPESLQANQQFGALYNSLLYIYKLGFLPIESRLMNTLNKLTRPMLIALAREICMPVFDESWGTEFIRARIRDHFSKLVDVRTPYGLKQYMKSIGYYVSHIIETGKLQQMIDDGDIPRWIAEWAQTQLQGYPRGFVFVIDERNVTQQDVDFILMKLQDYLPCERLRGIYSTANDYTYPTLLDITDLRTQDIDVHEVNQMAWSNVNFTPFTLNNTDNNHDTIQTAFANLIRQIVERSADWTCEFGADEEFCGYVPTGGIVFNYLYNTTLKVGFFITYIDPYKDYATLAPELITVMQTHHALSYAFDMTGKTSSERVGGFYIFPLRDAQPAMGMDRLLTFVSFPALINMLDMRGTGLLRQSSAANYMIMPIVERWGAGDCALNTSTYLKCFDPTLTSSIQKWCIDVCEECIILRVKTQVGTDTYVSYGFYIGARALDESGEALVIMFPIHSGYTLGDIQGTLACTVAMHGYEAIPNINRASPSSKAYGYPFLQAIATFKPSQDEDSVYAQYLFAGDALHYVPSDGTRRLRVRFPLVYDYWMHRDFMASNQSPLNRMDNLFAVCPFITDIDFKSSELVGKLVTTNLLTSRQKTIPTFLMSVCPVMYTTPSDPQFFIDQSLGDPEAGFGSYYKMIGGGVVIGQSAS